MNTQWRLKVDALEIGSGVSNERSKEMKSISILAALSIAVLIAGAIGERHATAQLPDLSSDTAATTSAGDGLQPRVTKLVKLSGPVSGIGCPGLIDEYGPHMSVDPANPKHLAVVYQLGDTASTPTQQVGVVASSFDGGTSWTRALLPQMTACSGGSNGVIGDPFIAIGSNGNVAATETWVSWDDPPTDAGDMRLYLSRSIDRGATFASPIQPENMLKPNVDARGPVLFDPQISDRLFVGFERTHYTNEYGLPDPNKGQILGLGGSLGVARYDDINTAPDDANTAPSVADAAVTLPGEEAATVGLFRSGDNVVLIGYLVEDADIPASFSSGFLGSHGVPQAGGIPLAEHLFAVRSRDDGATFGGPKPVVRWAGTAVVGDNSPGYIGTYNNSGFIGCCIPHAAAGPDSSMYVTWTDGATNEVYTATNGVLAKTNGVYLARSNDGANWTGKDSPVIVTPNGALESAVAARDDGVIALFYYAFTPDAELHQILTPYVAVTKDGVTWNAIKIAAPLDLSKLTGGANDGPLMGPYQDIIALPDGFGVAVTLNDPKDPTREHVYYVKVSVAR
jgi:hypothetical protein